MFKEYAHYYNLIYKDKPYAKEVKFVFDWLGYKPKIILDMGCGTGKHAQHFAKKSVVLGIDQSVHMLDKAYRHKRISYWCIPIGKELKGFPKLECAVALFNICGYVRLEEILPHLQLKKGGHFIFDCWDSSKIRNDPPQLRSKRISDKTYRLSIPHQIVDNKIRIDYIIVDNSKVTVFEEHSIYLYHPLEIVMIADRYGYKVTDIHKTKNWDMWYKLEKK